MEIVGAQFVGGTRSAESGMFLYSYNAETGERLPYEFREATEGETDRAAAAAAAAFPSYRAGGLEERAAFLEAIAAGIESLGDSLVETVMLETGLPESRVRGERARTCNQLRLFAAVVRRGDFLGVRIDTALPERQPLPRPDIRQYRVGLGPIAVFGAGNFPLAFSVAGGDTAAALAAGCPVIVKAHCGHLATSELVGQAVAGAVDRCRLPPGVFGMLYGGERVGASLVMHPAIRGAGFTGSLRGGRALIELAAKRPEPIPVFAEMSSVNPVIILPEALEQHSEAIAAGLAASVTLGAGQFCTNPGLVIACAGEAFEKFCRYLALEIGNRPPAVMLNRPTLAAYRVGIERFGAMDGVKLIARGAGGADRAEAALFRADASLLFHPDHPLEEELFGPATVVVGARGPEEVHRFLSVMRGELTASLFATPSDMAGSPGLIETLETRVGRIILNDYPTGVEVCDAMVHGGPWPATSDSRSTSVGSAAIERFLRPVCYQGYPDPLLPPPLKNDNPLQLRRLVDGEWTT